MLFAALFAAAAAVAFVFLLLPIVAIFLRVPLGDLLGALGNDVARDALVVSLKTSAIAHAAVLALRNTDRLLCSRVAASRAAAPCSRWSSCRSCCRLRWQASRCSRRSVALGLLGDELTRSGIQIAFTQTAVVLAVAFVESPFYLRGAIAAFEAIDAT